jgi:hypothetical protein
MREPSGLMSCSLADPEPAGKRPCQFCLQIVAIKIRAVAGIRNTIIVVEDTFQISCFFCFFRPEKRNSLQGRPPYAFSDFSPEAARVSSPVFTSYR